MRVDGGFGVGVKVGEQRERGRHRSSCATQQNLWCISKLSGRSVVWGLIRPDTSFVSGGKELHARSNVFAHARARTLRKRAQDRIFSAYS